MLQPDAFIDQQTAEERSNVLTFGLGWRKLARETRAPDTHVSPIEEEQTMLLLLLTSAIPAMAKAIARRDLEQQREMMDTMRSLVDGLEALQRVEDQVRLECVRN